MHAVSTITSGRRYAFLPFLYDEAAARIREENAPFLNLHSGAAEQDTQDGPASPITSQPISL
jgi:hypothetical protein